MRIWLLHTKHFLAVAGDWIWEWRVVLTCIYSHLIVQTFEGSFHGDPKWGRRGLWVCVGAFTCSYGMGYSNRGSCLFWLTSRHWTNVRCIFLQILDEVEKRREMSPALVHPFMRSVMEAPFPAPGRTITVRSFLPGAGHEVMEIRMGFPLSMVSLGRAAWESSAIPTAQAAGFHWWGATSSVVQPGCPSSALALCRAFLLQRSASLLASQVMELCRPLDSRLEHVDFECLFKCLSVSHTIRVFASLLLERRVIFVADNLR